MAISRDELSALGGHAASILRWTPRIALMPARAPAAKRRENGKHMPSKLALDWFFDLHDHPLRRTTVRDRMLGYTPEQGKKAREELEEWRLVEKYTLHTGRRGGQLVMYVITEEGYERLAAMGVTPKRMRGRGSLLHKLWQNIVAESLNRRHPEGIVKVEDAGGAGAGKRVDVSLIMPRPHDGATTVAYEVHLSGDAEDALIQALKDIDAQFDKVVTCVERVELLDQVKMRLSQELEGEQLCKVDFAALAEFLE